MINDTFTIDCCSSSLPLESTFDSSLWEIELEMLDVFVRICEKHNLRYFAIGGTLLGAARHGGYIPWDDDIDLAMPRTDFLKFLEVIPEELCDPLFFQSYETDEGFGPWLIKIRNSNTTYMTKFEMEEAPLSMNKGIFIDIFPLCQLPNGLLFRYCHIGKIRAIMRLIEWQDSFAIATHNAVYANNTNVSFKRRLLNRVSSAAGSREDLCRIYKETCLKHFKNHQKVGLCSFAPGNQKLVWNASYFETSVSLPFEQMNISVPAGWKNVLSQQYGEWNKPKRDAAYHTAAFIDPQKPFSEYINKCVECRKEKGAE